MLTEATAYNLSRKRTHADHVQWVDGVPIFSWLELSITELCNRSAGSPKACAFCPRIDASFYPNVPLHMSLPLAQRIGNELSNFFYEGAVVLCGYGEPLLHPKFLDLCEAFRGVRLEVVTNGDKLNPCLIRDMYKSGVDFIVVSMYDGPHQGPKFDAMFFEAGIEPRDYLLRDRWHGADQDFGLKLTNRAGVVTTGNQPEVDVKHPCFYPSYQMLVDWNGDVLLCPQDWHKRVKFGNAAHQSLRDIWNGSQMRRRRKTLAHEGRESLSPCSSCNAEGCLHGAQHVQAWEQNSRIGSRSAT